MLGGAFEPITTNWSWGLLQLGFLEADTRMELEVFACFLSLL